MYLFLFFISSLLIHNVYSGLVDRELNYTFYETNYLKSDIKRYNKIKSCSTNTDCPKFAYCKKLGNYNYCDFRFHCRTDYACFLALPKNDQNIYQLIKGNVENVNGTVENVNSTVSHEFSVKINNNKYEKEFVLGDEINLKMSSSLKNDNYCSNSCTENTDCYSEICDSNCCVVNEKIKEYICGPKEPDVEKAKNVTELEETKIECKSDNNQNCSKNSDCFTGICDYSGICVEKRIESETKKYRNEINVFYVFIVLIIVLITSVLLCSLYFGRRENKPGKGKRKHFLED